MEFKIKALMLNELKKIGLTENEAGTYLALLEMGSSTAQEISRKSGIKRATTYVQLESLMKIGLVTSFEKGKKTFFRSEDPEHLAKIAEHEKRLARERESALSEILPDLGKLYLSSGERPRVRFFEGIEGIKTMQGEFLKTHAKEIFGASSFDDVLRIFPRHLEEYSPKIAKRGILAKLIYTSAKGPILKNTNETLSRESRFVPPEKFPFSCDVSVYGDTVAILVLKNKIFGVAVENKEIADSMRALFGLAWEEAKKYQQ